NSHRASYSPSIFLSSQTFTLRILCGHHYNIQRQLRALSVYRLSFGEETMEKPVQNIQDVFLNNARRDKTVTTIYLMSGVKLTGRIKSFDKYSVILESNNQDQLIFKHAISTVAAGRSFSVAASTPVSASAETAS